MWGASRMRMRREMCLKMRLLLMGGEGRCCVRCAAWAEGERFCGQVCDGGAGVGGDDVVADVLSGRRRGMRQLVCSVG